MKLFRPVIFCPDSCWLCAQRRQTAVSCRPLERPSRGPAKLIAPGVMLHEVALKPGGQGALWIYLPEKPASEKLPCVLIAPAGSNLLTGMKLDPSDSKEHIPYAKAGMVVVAYAIDGHLDDRAHVKDADVLAATKAFMDSDAGVANAKAALDYALANVPNIDPKRIFSAGHSSAATLSLQVAAREPRLAGCIAYAPVTDLEKRIPAPAVTVFSKSFPGFKRFLQNFSPLRNVAKITCPVLLFHAADDSNVPIAQTEAFAKALQKTNKNVTFLKAKSGGHFDSMIAEGIPMGITGSENPGEIMEDKVSLPPS